MRRANFYADVHVHPTIKSANSGHPKPSSNIWEDIEHILPVSSMGRLVSRSTLEISKFSQSNLYRMAKGKVRLVFASLYPIESGFINLRNFANWVTKKKVQHELLSIITGMSTDRIKYLQKKNIYSEEYEKEYQYLMNQQGKSPDGKYFFKVCENYKDVHQTLKEDHGIAIVHCVEGAHVFIDKKMASGKLNKREMKHSLKKNIEEVKSWERPPFIINLAHHFYHGFCGHAKTFFQLEVGEGLLNQKKGLNIGLEGLGIKAMKEMLSNRNGKRIHIDTKHMSLKSRQEFYNWIRSYNYLNSSNNIPIICSHTGVNGYKTMSGSIRSNDNTSKKNEGYFFKWSLNISDEEIRIIHESNGLIGVMVDKTKLGGGKFYANLSKLKDDQKIKDAYLKLIWDNLFQIVDAIGNKSAWDIISIGSDYDGAIQHVEGYETAEKMPLLYDDLLTYLKKENYQKDLWYDLEPIQILNKIFQKNAMVFLERYFV